LTRIGKTLLFQNAVQNFDSDRAEYYSIILQLYLGNFVCNYLRNFQKKNASLTFMCILIKKNVRHVEIYYLDAMASIKVV